MIRATLYIPEHDWIVHCYFAVDCYYTYEILDMMRRVGADSKTLERAHKNLISGELDSGLCYSNSKERETVWVTSLTSSPDEFMNSLVHEIRHLQQHIAKEFGMDEDSEDVCYLCGYIAQRMYAYCHSLLCGHCREKMAKSTSH